MATGFLVGFTVGALLTLIGPAAFMKIAPYVPYLLLLLGGLGAYDSFSDGHIAQGVFRIIVTLVSVGLANATVRAKVFQFANYLWAKVFPVGTVATVAATTAPRLAGHVPTGDAFRRIVYNSATKEVWVGSEEQIMHVEVVGDATKNGGWRLVKDIMEQYVGGHASFKNGKLFKWDWISGHFPGTTTATAEADAAVSIISAK